MVDNKRVADRRKTMSARNRNQRQLLSANNTQKMVAPRSDSPNYKTTDNGKFKKIVLFDSRDDKVDSSMNDSNSSSNGSELRASTNYVSFGRSSCMSARSNRSSGGTSSSSNGTDVNHNHNPIRPQRSISTPASSRSSRGSTRPPTKDNITPRPLSRARMGSRGSFVSSEGLSTPRNSSRGLKRKERVRISRCDSMESTYSEDFSPREPPPPLPQPLSPEMVALTEQSKMVWDQFSTHVKMIDDSSDLISRRPRKTFNSSGIFQKAMEDLYGSPEYWKSRGVMKFQNRVGAIAKFASKFIVGARRVKALHESKEGEESDEDDLFLDYEPSKETIENAQRGWRILRRHVNEMAAERRMNQTTLTWDMLRHTLKGISNMHRARVDLYQRYGLLPMIKNDGTVVQENTMLSERARSALSSKPKQSTPPTRHSSASTTKKNRTYSAIEGFTGTGVNLSLSL